MPSQYVSTSDMLYSPSPGQREPLSYQIRADDIEDVALQASRSCHLSSAGAAMVNSRRSAWHENQPAARRAFVGFGDALKRHVLTAHLTAHLTALLDAGSAHGASTSQVEPSCDHPDESGEPERMEMDQDEDWIDVDDPPLPTPPTQIQPPKPLERTPTGDTRAWDILLPLQHPFQYQRENHGQVPTIIPATPSHVCTVSCGKPINLEVQCLYPTHFKTVQVSTCECMPAGILLVKHGVFPASPTKPCTVVSIDLLDLYPVLFECSCDAITALAAALHTGYDRQGFRNLGMRAVNPFRSALTNAVQWSSNLRCQLQARVDAALANAAALLSPTAPIPNADSDSNINSNAASVRIPDPTNAGEVPPIAEEEGLPELDADGRPERPIPADPSSPSTAIPDTDAEGESERTAGPQAPPLTRGSPHRILQEGGDVQLRGDSCFSYRHLASAGDSGIPYDPTYFIPKEKVDKVEARIAEVRKKPAARCMPPIPQEAINACKDSWEAANKKKRKADPHRYDGSGVFALTCRHSQTLFLYNIDSPGEEQKYIVAALEEVQGLLPPCATILQYYDVGCVADHSCNLFPILSLGLRERVSFCINAMHAFGHQWVCQMVYSPRLCRGCSLSDMEGIERFWSRVRKLIPLTRNQWKSRRIWMLDLYASFVNQEGRDSPGSWIVRQEQKNVEWKRVAPARLKRELNKVLQLQVQIDTVETSITEVKTSITGGTGTEQSRCILLGLQTTHQSLSNQAESLYTSLNLQGVFPELQGLPLEFVRTLLLMRELKINIRSRVVGSFYKWETLDRAVSGRREPLGTKLHQATRKVITKRQPALIRSIKKFNNYCARLVQLNGLHNDPTLHEDVWIQYSNGPIPRWLDDYDVRDGIRSMHVLNRCCEEAKRLDLERANLDRWLTFELEVVRKALEDCDPALYLLLMTWQEELKYLRLSWAPALFPLRAASRNIASTAPGSVPAATSHLNGSPAATATAVAAVPAAVPTAAAPRVNGAPVAAA
ncbi:hypothetical protein K438DRAFT_1993511 [Mycena galopus ATCC 62051]|nr:hypothetical protein K438DRAFT_1993511 [Mycena galopus ATCC 62051]